jgi:hypothetical protein
MTISIFIALNVTAAFLLMLAGVVMMMMETPKIRFSMWGAFFFTSTMILGFTMVGTWAIAMNVGQNIW